MVAPPPDARPAPAATASDAARTPPPPVGAGRLALIDVVRLLAAVVVVVEHLRNTLDPGFLAQAQGWERILRGAASNGHLAVCLFFVMSGYVIARGHGLRPVALPVAAVARVLRLGVPIALTTALVVALATSGVLGQPQIVAAAAPGQLLTRYGADAFAGWGVADWVQAGLIAPLTGADGRLEQVNSVYWTMPYETLGSLGVLGVMALPLDRARRLGLLLLGVAVLGLLDRVGGYFALILAGAALALAVDAWPALPRAIARMRWPGSCLALTLALLAAPLAGREEQWSDLPLALAMFVAILALGWRLGEPAWLVRLARAGRLTFPLYLSHVPVLECLLLPLLIATGSQSLALVLTAAAIAAAAIALDRAAEQPALALSRRLRRWGERWLPMRGG